MLFRVLLLTSSVAAVVVAVGDVILGAVADLNANAVAAGYCC